MRPFILLGLLLVGTPLPAAEPGAEFFEAEIRPILIKHCQECHSAKKTKGGLIIPDTAKEKRAGNRARQTKRIAAAASDRLSGRWRVADAPEGQTF